MTVFVDTSALYNLLDRDNAEHAVSAARWDELTTGAETLRTHSYVVVEAAALVQARLGMDAARTLHNDIAPALSIRFVDAPLHERAVAALLAANRRSVSLVDWTSFELMREEGITDAFAFDDDFAAQGFSVGP